MGCLGCGRGFHDECDTDCEHCHDPEDSITKSITTIGTGRGASIKDSDDVGDRHSTGRKRAAVWYPIVKTNPCEWQGKKNCGGGRPIIGCINGLQRHRHHGPVKDTLENTPGNVHRICTHCHRRWHAVNDPHYVEEEYRKLPHAPEEATEMELVANEAKWRITL